jgi:hypothetical protein
MEQVIGRLPRNAGTKKVEAKQRQAARPRRDPLAWIAKWYGHVAQTGLYK